MAQYYQVTSVEELHRLYPNLQLDNLEGIPCMIQDDQATPYTDSQGHQVIATVEQSGMQLPQNLGVSQQCTSQQSQYVVHQPTQYFIQQMEGNESKPPTVQYIQQGHQLSQNKIDISESHFNDQNSGCAAEIGAEEHSPQRNTIQQDCGQFVPQVQSVLHQPMQIHQPIQAVDMGGNILVLQNPEQHDVINQSKRRDMILNQSSQEKQMLQQPQQQHLQQQQQQKQQFQLQQHQPQSQQHIIIQTQQNVSKGETPSQQITQQQALQNRQGPQREGQHQQIIQHPQQQIIQQLQYYNQVTVIDNFSQPNGTIEHRNSSTENRGQPQQSELQQPGPQPHVYKNKKLIQQPGISSVIQPPQQMLIPQRFEMTSPPPLATRTPQPRKKGHQDIEANPSPVYIVQKLDSPYLVSQPQTEIRFQSSTPNSEKVNESSFHPVSTQHELNENLQVMRSNPQITPQIDSQQQTMTITGPVNKFTPERNQTTGQVKLGIIEKPHSSRSVEQLNKQKAFPTITAKLSVPRIKTSEQQTESTITSDRKGTNIQQYERFLGNIQVQPQNPISVSQFQPVLQSQNQPQNSQIQIAGRGRPARGVHCVQLARGGQQLVPRARGIQVQTSPPRLPNDRGIGKKVKSPRKGNNKAGRGGWVPCGLNQRQQSPIRPGTPQVVRSTSPKNESTQNVNESSEDARMVVILMNDEKKIVRIPCSQQNILLGQILQQAGLQISSPTAFTIEQVGDTNSEQLIIKSTSLGSQQQSTPFKTNVSQVTSIGSLPVTPRSLATTIQHQRPRAQSPAIVPGSATNIRHRLHFTSTRVSAGSPSVAQTLTNVILEPSIQPSQNLQSAPSQLQPQKEEPRFVKGFMAICPFCGISSLDFNKCIRCRRKLPENVKSQSIFNAKKKKATTGTEKSDSEEKPSDSPSFENKERISTLQIIEKKKSKACIKKKKISDEPAEILILSSDEEEDPKAKKTNIIQKPMTVLRKEPIYAATELAEIEINSLPKETNLNEDLMKNVQSGSYTTLLCRTIKIGSYKIQPKERVLVSCKGVRMVVTTLKNDPATIAIPVNSILKILIHFGKQIPVIFIYPLPKVGCQIRNILGMDEKTGPYYDPTSTQEETHKRITLLLEKITEDNKIVLSKIFGPAKLEELSEKEANEILIRASPVDLQNCSYSRPTDAIRKIMVYPPPPEKGGITLNNQDYACLGEDQFLNDVIIDFYLKYLTLKVLSPEDRNRTHVFSTFFYKRLTTKPKTVRKNDPENDPKLSPAEKRHMRVKGWTKQVNLFEKDFIIVPINEHSHWFLAIICFPGLTGPVKFSDNTPVEPDEVVSKKNTQSLQIGNTTITQIIKAEGNTISLEMDSGSDRDEAEGDQDDLHPSDDDEESEQTEEESNSSQQQIQIPLLASSPQQQPAAKETKPKPVKKKPLKEPIKQPCILIFDSLAGASRVRVVATLRDYLKIEYKKKMGQERDFSKDTIKGAVPKVPQQNNFTDCGLYVLQYVESFFQDPLHDFKLPLKYLQDWFPEEVVSTKRQKLAGLIRTLMEEQGLNVEDMGLPALTFTNGNSVGDDQSRIEEDEDEDEDELNEEENEMLRNQIRISGFDHDDDEDLDLGEEEEEDEMEEELEDEFDDEELEEGEFRSQWFAKARNACNESSVSHLGGHVILKPGGLVDYEHSDSDQEGQTLSHNSEIMNSDQMTLSTEEGEYCETGQPVITEKRKSVPLTELQDFESQISCTTIERNKEGKNTESELLMSEEDERCEVAVDEEEASFEMSESDNTDNATNSFSETLESVERLHPQHTEVIVKESKSIEVNNMIQKLVNDKNITINKKEEESDVNLLKKQIDVKRFKAKDCDKNDESKKLTTSTCLAQKNNLATCKRSFQALKSVRIPKKAERKLEVTSKRQKLDER